MAVIVTVASVTGMPTLSDGTIIFAQDVKRHYMVVTSVPYEIPIFSDLIVRRTYVNGIAQNGTPKTGDIIEWIDTSTVSSGSATFFLTSDHTSAGTAICSSIFSGGIRADAIDSSATYPKGAVTVAASLKSVSIPLTKLTTTGIVVAGITVIGSISYSTAPNGITVNATIIGIAA